MTLIVMIYFNSVRSTVMLNHRKHLKHLENKVKNSNGIVYLMEIAHILMQTFP